MFYASFLRNYGLQLSRNSYWKSLAYNSYTKCRYLKSQSCGGCVLCRLLCGVDDVFGHIGFVVEGQEIFFVVGADVRVFGANINPSDMRAEFFNFRDDF